MSILQRMNANKNERKDTDANVRYFHLLYFLQMCAQEVITKGYNHRAHQVHWYERAYNKSSKRVIKSRAIESSIIIELTKGYTVSNLVYKYTITEPTKGYRLKGKQLK